MGRCVDTRDVPERLDVQDVEWIAEERAQLRVDEQIIVAKWPTLTIVPGKFGNRLTVKR